MKAIPAAGAAEGAGGRATINPFDKLSDNSDSYEGRLVLDLDRGQVREDVEQMQNEWIIPDPASVAKGEPVAIRMAARRLHRLERLPPTGGNSKFQSPNSQPIQNPKLQGPNG